MVNIAKIIECDIKYIPKRKTQGQLVLLENLINIKRRNNSNSKQNFPEMVKEENTFQLILQSQLILLPKEDKSIKKKTYRS